MGFSHSVFIAQTIHEHILYSSSLLSSVDNILNRLSPQIDSSPHALYIDDCIVLDCCLSPAQKYYHALFFTTEDGILMSSSNDTVSSGDVADPSLSDAPRAFSVQPVSGFCSLRLSLFSFYGYFSFILRSYHRGGEAYRRQGDFARHSSAHVCSMSLLSATRI